jgi:hypothetical protein
MQFVDDYDAGASSWALNVASLSFRQLDLISKSMERIPGIQYFRRADEKNTIARVFADAVIFAVFHA